MKQYKQSLGAILVIILSVAYQVHCAIHGFDLTDEGYLMSLYHWFGNDIDFAQGAGGYPLTCYLGWTLDHLFPHGGILGMRLWGILVVTLTEIVAFLYLKRYFEPKAVLMGLLMQTVFVAGDPKPFGYNTLTAFIGIVAFILLCEGTLRRRYSLMFGGGLLLGVNVFVRLPNLASLAFLALPFIVTPRETMKLELRKNATYALTIGCGFITATIAVWELLVYWGADKLTVELITSIPETLGGDSTHASDALLTKYIDNYLSCVWHFFVFCLLAVVAGVAFRLKSRLLGLAVLAAVVFFLYQNTYMRSNMLGDTLLAMMNGLGLFGSLYYYNKEKDKRAIALGAIIMSLIFPLGSDGGFQTMWVGTWLMLPVGLSGIYDFISRSAEKQKAIYLLFCSPSAKNTQSGLKAPASHIKYGYAFCLLVLLVTIFIKIEHKVYYDPGDRIAKVHPINSSMAKGIYTGAEKAAIVNPMLDELKRYVKAGDTLLVYDSSPLVYYLTDTRPFAGISWPCVFYGKQYVRKFMQAERETSTMPVLVMQYFYSSNNWSEIQDDYYALDSRMAFSNLDMKQNILRFIGEHRYKTVWSNGYYKIMIPKERLDQN